MKIDHQTAARTAMSTVGMADLAYALTNPGNATTFEYTTLHEFIARAPHFDVSDKAVTAARRRLSDAAGRGNRLAAELIADLATRSAS